MTYGRYFTMSRIFIFLVFLKLIFLCSAQDDIIVFPKHDKEKNLATMINCHVDENRYFRYSSVTKLWGDVQGLISLNADVTLYCMGDDSIGKFGPEALRYRIEVSNLNMEEKHPTLRKKRSIGDFFKNTWSKIKEFFGRMFGGNRNEEKKKWDEDARSGSADSQEQKPESPIEEEETYDSLEYNHLYSLPFEFVQLANGSIPEVRFAESDADGRVRNFKRHLVDAFATQLSPGPDVVRETSVMGEHLTAYNVTVGATTPGYLASLEGVEASPLVGFEEEENEETENMVVVEKLITEGDILNLATDEQSAALNNREQMELKATQRQVFKGGRMVSSIGSSDVSLFDFPSRRRAKRDAIDALSLFTAQSQFELQLETRSRRSLREKPKSEDKTNSLRFLPASRYAETENTTGRQKLRDLQKSFGNPTAFVQNLLLNPPDEEKIQIVFEMVEQEVRLGLDHEATSMASAIRTTISEQVIYPLCSKNFNKCRDFLQLLALAGGREAEKVLVSCLTDKKGLAAFSRQQIADILSDISHPSENLLSSLRGLLQDGILESEISGVLCLSAASITSKASYENEKDKMAETLVAMLERNYPVNCRANSLTLDIFEAIGNLGHVKTMDYILKVSARCPDKTDIQIATAHALRHLASKSEVQEWMMQVAAAGNCDVIGAVLGSLLDEIYFQEMARDFISWPRNGINDFDKTLRKNLAISSKHFCAVDDAIRYFGRKRNPEDKSLVFNYFSEDAIPRESGDHSRQKRDLWDNLNCQEWIEDKKYQPIQSPEEFAADRATYNRRKSCLASRKLGLKGANANIYAGMFAGVKVPSDPPEYKLFTKFVSGVNFLGQEIEIGFFYFYHRSGNTKAYVRIMGRTRQEFNHEGCTPTELRYRPIMHIPLFHVTVSAVQLSLGIHLSTQLAMDTECPKTDVYQLQPFSTVRVGGEASGSVLFMRGTVNLGGNFNYKLQFTFNPYPDMCLEGHHGYDPMSLGFEAYYQLWSLRKNDWGKHRVWKPSLLNWEISNGKHRVWFNNTCVLKLPSENSQKSDFTFLNSTENDENEIFFSVN